MPDFECTINHVLEDTAVTRVVDRHPHISDMMSLVPLPEYNYPKVTEAICAADLEFQYDLSPSPCTFVSRYETKFVQSLLTRGTAY